MGGRSRVERIAASPTVVGAITTLIVIVAVFLAYNASNGLPFVPVYRISAELPNAARVVRNNEVRLGGHRIGVVESVQTTQNPQTGEAAAKLNLKLDQSVKPLPTTTQIRVRYKSSFGLKFLELVRRPGPPLPEGGTLPISQAVPQTEFDAINNTFDTATRENIRQDLEGYGNAFAARGASLNQAIESLNRLAVALNKQKPAITQALDELPRAVASINRQRDDLVKMLRALADLSSVGTRVIRASKAGTIDSLRALAPTLTKLSEAGDSLPKALQVFLTYPFVDAVVGKNPAQARSLHLGDYTNLSVQLDIDLSGLQQGCQNVPGLGDLPLNLCNNPQLASCVTQLLKTDPNNLPKSLELLLKELGNCTKGALGTICGAPGLPAQLKPVCDALKGLPLTLPTVPKVPIPVPSLSNLTKCLSSGKPLGAACDRVNPRLIAQRCARTSARTKPKGYYSDTCRKYRSAGLGLVGGGLGKLPVGGSGGSSGGGGGIVGGGGLPGLNRPAFGSGNTSMTATRTSSSSDLGAMLVWGMMQR